MVDEALGRDKVRLAERTELEESMEAGAPQMVQSHGTGVR